ncbi:MAG TPA: CARDB domain-containing protein [Candidatus Thermoplasmatota archaeon]|nr:CARDB domain-containing protein [Candidatus Thermoplasmatota archaeon]
MSDPWWGPSDRAQPTQGWALRVPIVVENKLDVAMQDPFVMAELDFGALLVQAGWTNETAGGELRARGFTLDVDSLRVVPYNAGFVTGPKDGPTTRPVPHVFYPAMLETGKYRDFSPDKNPAGTVMWQIPGSVKPHDKLFFYVYANPLEFGKTPPPAFDALEKSPLDAFLWGTRGNTYLGYEPKQPTQKHTLVVRALTSAPTSVRVSTYDLGFTLVPATPQFANPFLLQPGSTQVVTVPTNRPYKIEGDHPIAVYAIGDTSADWSPGGYVPGMSGSFADDAFQVVASFADFNGQQRFRVEKAGPGTVSVCVNGAPGNCPGGVTLTNAAPTAQVLVPAGSVALLLGTGKFLVSMDGVGERDSPEPSQARPFVSHPVPSLTGAASGVDFFSFIQDDAGYFRLCPESNATVRVLNYESGSLQIYPEGLLPNAPGKELEKRQGCEEVAVQKSVSPQPLYEFYTTPDARSDPPAPPAAFRLFVGAREREMGDPTKNVTRPMIGPYAGLAGIDYYVDTKDSQGVGIFGHYNNTKLTIVTEHDRNGELNYTTQVRSLQRDEFVSLREPTGDLTGQVHLLSTKPISAVSLSPAEFFTEDSVTRERLPHGIGYSYYPPGRPVPIDATIGRAEFRGPLVEIRSPQTEQRSLPLSTGPGSPLSVRLDVLNLGRWVAGEGLTDTIEVACSTPEGWTVEGCAKEFTLTSGSSERLNVVVTPSAEDVNKSRTILVEARSKAGGVAATFKISVYVKIAYGVGMWFDVEGGRKTIDPPIGLDPGAEHRYQIVVKNTGSTTDTFALAVEDPRPGWEQALLLDDEPVTSLRLDGGESTTLTFRVKAPNAETAPQNIVSITARSAASALAADVVNTATRIRPKVDLELNLDPQTRLAEPNETVRFNLTTRNKGNDVFTVIFHEDSILPKGWRADLSVGEITLNPNPANDPNLSYVLHVDVTPPPGARAGDLASVKIAAEIDTGGTGGRVAGDEVSAVVVVRRIYDLATAPVFDPEAEPGEVLHFVLPVTNRGNGQVAVELLAGATEVKRGADAPAGASSVTPAWPVTLESEGFTLEVNDSADLPLRIDVPAGTPPGAYNLTFTTRLSREALQNVSIPVNVKAVSRVDFGGPKSVGLTPGRPIALSYHVKNVGNVEGTFDLTAQAPEGWNATFAPTRAHLAPGEAVDALLSLNATKDAPDGAVRVELHAAVAGAAAGGAPLDVNVARPQLSLASVTGSGSLKAGELILVSATVQNAGGIEAENVSVALVVDGRTVDKVQLSRIPVGSSALATLSWVSTQRGGDVKVVLDPDNEMSLSDRSASEQGVHFGSKIGVPGPGLFALLAVIALVATTTRLQRGRSAARRRRAAVRPGHPSAERSEAPKDAFGTSSAPALRLAARSASGQRERDER